MEVKVPDMSDAQVKQIEALLVSGSYKSWAEAHLAATKEDIAAYVKTMGLKDFGGFEWVVERMVRDEISRTSIAPIFDLDYDIVLKEAVKLLSGAQDFQSLFKTTKTVRQIQDELAAQKAAKEGEVSAKTGKDAAGKQKQAASKAPGGLPSPEIE
jgi:carboxyl-terminal processing protease